MCLPNFTIHDLTVCIVVNGEQNRRVFNLKNSCNSHKKNQRSAITLSFTGQYSMSKLVGAISISYNMLKFQAD